MENSKYCSIEYQIRHIVWLVRHDDWESLEIIVKLCSCNYGGIYHPIICLDKNDDISPSDKEFVYLFDPDYIILPPDYNYEQKKVNLNFRVFEYILWKNRKIILNRNLSGQSSRANISFSNNLDDSRKINKIATYDENFPDESMFALMYFGDVNTLEPLWEEWDGVGVLYSDGLETKIIREKLKSTVDKKEAGAYLNDDEEIVPAPDRKKLNSILEDEYKYPFNDFKKQLELIYDYNNFQYKGFIHGTIVKNAEYHYEPIGKKHDIPALIFLVTNVFDFKTALYFWNYRATGNNAFWLNLATFKENIDTFIEWIDSDYASTFTFISSAHKPMIQFITDNRFRTNKLITLINNSRKKNWIELEVGNYQIEFHDKPVLKKNENLIFYDDFSVKFHSDPQFSQNAFGSYTTRIIDDKFRLPYLFNDRAFFGHKRNYFFQFNKVTVPKYRIDVDGFLTIQQDRPETIDILYPDDDYILEKILKENGVSIEETTTAKYQREIINIFGGISVFATFYIDKDIRYILNALANTKDKNKPEQIVEHPYKMRVCNLGQFSEMIKSMTLEGIKLVNFLVTKNILDCGFIMKCRYCDYRGFYLFSQIDRTYGCGRCSKENHLLDNPEIKYRLNPIICAGIEQNIDVPLLAIYKLSKISIKYFKWYYEKNIVFDGKKGNVDIICFIDGLLYVGEAKSNDVIDAEQMSFYERIAEINAVSGLIFATSKSRWKKDTKERIDKLRKKVLHTIVLARDDLFKE